MVQFNYQGYRNLNIGYPRVSTRLQNLDLEKDSFGYHGCEKIFTDHMSGSKMIDLI